MKLNEIRDNEGARPSRMRVGRGIGSGKGKTGGRGVKGQKSRSGVAIKGYEGGQMPIYRRLPKRGFTNIFGKDFNVVSIARLEQAVEAGRLDAKGPITVESLIAAGIVRRAKDGVRVLSDGDVKSKFDLHVAGASRSAIEKIEKAGGTVTVGVAPSDVPSVSSGKSAKAAAVVEFIDDIVLIDGIGDKTAEALKAAGVGSLTQIVAMSDADLAKAAADAGAEGKEVADEWKVQAQEMISGKPPRAKVDQALAKKMLKERAKNA